MDEKYTPASVKAFTSNKAQLKVNIILKKVNQFNNDNINWLNL